MSVLIIGHLGSMGKRYSAILKHLGVKHYGVDKDFTKRDIVKAADNFQRIILCTPTHTHISLLRDLIPLGKPILCEKPITTDLDQLEEVLELLNKYKTYFSMVMQYQELINYSSSGQSSYDYFRTGNDGLIWDCFQIIALSKMTPSLNNMSPVWKCVINGQTLSISDMDNAYIGFVSKWLRDAVSQDPNYLYEIHERVAIEHERYTKLQSQRN